MIPNIIHYCWFGGNPLPPLALKCINSWKEHCPDFEVREWNEKNFDINCNTFVKQAYAAKKYAFVSDFVRLYVLYNYGGIYMDSDVEVLRPLDIFLQEKSFSGFEAIESVSTGIMGCESHHPFWELLLQYYGDRSFIKEDGTYDMTTNVKIITDFCEQYGVKLNNTKQTVRSFTLYPTEYFCPKDYKTGKVNTTDITYTIHHYSGSWVPRSIKVKNKISSILGPKVTQIIVDTKKRLYLRG